MKRYHGRDEVGPGLYFQPGRLSFEARPETRPLPGDPSEVYFRVPALLLLVAGPLLGLLFAIFLPFIGLVMLARLLVTRAFSVAADAARVAPRSGRPSWEPRTAFLSRARQRRGEEGGDDAWARDAEERIESRESEDEPK